MKRIDKEYVASLFKKFDLGVATAMTLSYYDGKLSACLLGALWLEHHPEERKYINTQEVVDLLITQGYDRAYANGLWVGFDRCAILETDSVEGYEDGKAVRSMLGTQDSGNLDSGIQES